MGKEKTINDYGTKFHIEHEEEECDICGIIGVPEHILFVKGFADAIPFCSDNCLFRHCQNMWARKKIEYCNSRKSSNIR